MLLYLRVPRWRRAGGSSATRVPALGLSNTVVFNSGGAAPDDGHELCHLEEIIEKGRFFLFLHRRYWYLKGHVWMSMNAKGGHQLLKKKEKKMLVSSFPFMLRFLSPLVTWYQVGFFFHFPSNVQRNTNCADWCQKKPRFIWRRSTCKQTPHGEI